MILSLGTPPPLTQHTAAKRPAAPTHECTGPAGSGPRRIATEKKGRASGTAINNTLDNTAGGSLD